LRDEIELRLKRAYWQGVFDALNPGDRSRSEKSDKERLTSEVWLNALDWILGQTDDSTSILGKVENKK
jgi:hypothetical protein